MNKTLLQIIGLFSASGTLLFTGIALAQSLYPSNILDLKGNFSRGAATAMGEPFQGVRTSAGIIDGLYPIRSTGVSTDVIRVAADAFLASLDNIELSRTHFAVDDPEWRDWSNVDVGIFPRRGLSLEEMDAEQKAAAWQLLEVSLSRKGLEQTRAIMRTEQTLLELNGEPIRYGEEKYYITMMGVPTADGPWGWQLDGHHLVINFFVLGDQVVMTPAFWGGEPVVAQAGKYAGNTIMQPEQDLGLALMQSLGGAQQQAATINREKTRNYPMAAANADNKVQDYEGIRGSDLSSAQRLALLDLIEAYISNLRDPHADVTMAEIAEHLDTTYFAWIGGAEDDAVFYYRVHSPVIMIEFDHQNPVGTQMLNTPGQPTRDHIHTVVRTPNGNDYGKDLLAQHLASVQH